MARWNSGATWDSGLRWNEPDPPSPNPNPTTKTKRMKRQDYFPSRIGDQTVWLQNFKTKLPSLSNPKQQIQVVNTIERFAFPKNWGQGHFLIPHKRRLHLHCDNPPHEQKNIWLRRFLRRRQDHADRAIDSTLCASGFARLPDQARASCLRHRQARQGFVSPSGSRGQ